MNASSRLAGRHLRSIFDVVFWFRDDLIAFVSIRSVDPHIYVHTAGTDRQITQAKGVHTHPSLSGDGRLAYVKSIGGLGKVFITDPGGANARRLTQGERIGTSPPRFCAVAPAI